MGEKKVREEVWQILKELGESQKEIRESHKDAQKELREFRESQRESQKELEKLREAQAETDRQRRRLHEEVAQQFRETDKKIDKLGGHFDNHWGKLIEALVDGDLVKLLKERNIKVDKTITNFPGIYQGRNYEFDILAINSNELVVVEVKTTLWPQDVDKFSKRVEMFKKICPEYGNKTIYAGVAYLNKAQESPEKAIQEGFFVIRATGSSASIINDKNFKPREF